MFENRRVYRSAHNKKGLVPFEITVKQTNLHIQADKDLSSQAVKAVLCQRQFLDAHIAMHPEFETSLVPLPDPGVVPAIVMEMIQAGQAANVGPMAAVAGAMAAFTGKALLKESREIIVENGGDIFIRSCSETIVPIFAGNSPLSMKTGIKISGRSTAYGLCTSSGSFGHSKSFGSADAVCVLADSCPVADATATRLCNMVRSDKDIETVLEKGRQIAGIQGMVIISGKTLGAWGDLELIPI
jgi:ApbE superfamily uncharacterized protein (UPF0280 family)